MKKILVICQYYYPENFQITPICEQLIKDGFDVTVLTGLPNYPTGIIPSEYRKGKKREEIINDVKVIRTYEIGRKRGPVFLALNYISFLISSCIKIKYLKEEYDSIFVYQLSPVLMGIPGVKYAKRHKVPLNLYCLDLWPESMKMYVHNEKNPIFKFIKKISSYVYKNCDRIIVQSSSFLSYFTNIHKIESSKLCYIPAFADEEYLKIPYKKRNGDVNFIFLGNLGIAQNLMKILEAINKIKNMNGFKIHFVGDGSCLDEMKKYVAENNLEKKVIFYGRRPVEEMPKYYEIADACIVSLKANNQTGFTLPAKVQGYMAAGKPIFGMIEGSAKDVIEESNCGVCVPSDDVDSFADVLKDFIINEEKYEKYGSNGRDFFIKRFTKDKFMNDIELILKL